MDELTRWLGQQLDKDERIARAATPGPWVANKHEYGAEVYTESGEGVAFDHDAGGVGWDDADFIATHDPARVLREIDAKRQLLDDYTVTARIRDEAAVRIKAAGSQPDAKDLDTWDRAQREAAILEGPVKLLALPFADRPGYKESWRP
jgi:hypothetical protein